MVSLYKSLCRTVERWLGQLGYGDLGDFTATLRVVPISALAIVIGALSAFVARTVLTRVHFRGDPGASYRFRVTAFDRAVNRASFESGVISIPVDDRDARYLRFGKGWT